MTDAIEALAKEDKILSRQLKLRGQTIFIHTWRIGKGYVTWVSKRCEWNKSKCGYWKALRSKAPGPPCVCSFILPATDTFIPLSPFISPSQLPHIWASTNTSKSLRTSQVSANRSLDQGPMISPFSSRASALDFHFQTHTTTWFCISGLSCHAVSFFGERTISQLLCPLHPCTVSTQSF